MTTEKRKQYLDNYVDARKRISISLSISDYEKVKYLAELNQTKPTSYISDIVQQQLNKSPVISKQLSDEIRSIKFLLRNIATNINQIAHRSNTLKILVEDRELLLELKKLEDGIKEHIYKDLDK